MYFAVLFVVVAWLLVGAQVVTDCDEACRSTCQLRGILGVGNKGSDTADFVDLSTGQHLGRVKTGWEPHGIASNGDVVVIANHVDQTEYGHDDPYHLTLIDLATLTFRGNISTFPYKVPHDLEFINPNEVLVTAEDDSALLQINVYSGLITRVIDTSPHDCHEFSRDVTDNIIFCGDKTSNPAGAVGVIDLELGRTIHSIFLEDGAEAEGGALSPDGREVWFGDRTRGTVWTIDRHTYHPKSRLSPAGVMGSHRAIFTPNYGTIDEQAHDCLMTHPEFGDISVFGYEHRSQQVLTLPYFPETPRRSVSILLPATDARCALACGGVDDSIHILALKNSVEEYQFVGKISGFVLPDDMAIVSP